jgi:hypothetical protein
MATIERRTGRRPLPSRVCRDGRMAGDWVPRYADILAPRLLLTGRCQSVGFPWKRASRQALLPRLQRTAMKEGLPGGTLSVTPRSELEEARHHVARWIGSQSTPGRHLPAF